LKKTKRWMSNQANQRLLRSISQGLCRRSKPRVSVARGRMPHLPSIMQGMMSSRACHMGHPKMTLGSSRPNQMGQLFIWATSDTRFSTSTFNGPRPHQSRSRVRFTETPAAAGSQTAPLQRPRLHSPSLDSLNKSEETKSLQEGRQ